ncbi:substrate-binding domain-containing protein [Curtobacterium caseinilyticum]|uniref:Substrate-binding domain-containing protein n=1 Tax=Curtobacterium caseinilyticum TaxID=3055137 RepID=A0ABT7TTA4_9MICO|nr:substrate-binding domain-containing protein [Curtobacterium caseinilyticum]MDM7892837.1 substrate-binding domain-containing protein [Curtobacterium caseinilyticum]
MTVDLARSFNRMTIEGPLSAISSTAWALRCDPPLSTVRQPARTLGEPAAQQVLAHIAGDDEEPRGLVLPTEVVRRGSA